MKPSVIGVLPENGIKKDDVIVCDGVTFRVISRVESNTLTVRGLYWYEKFWFWIKKLLS